jgi:integrase
MTRSVTDARIETPAARAKLKISPTPYWRALDHGLHLGYRKTAKGGRWLARWYLRGIKPEHEQSDGTVYKHAGGKAYKHTTLPGITDDNQPADGAGVLNFAQAQKKARELFAKAMAPSLPAGPLTVREATTRYVKYLKADRKTGRDTEQRLAKHVLPQLGARPVASLTAEEIEDCKRRMAQVRPGEDADAGRRRKATANRVLTNFRAAMNKAFADPANQIPTDAAWRRVKLFKNVNRAREVFLSPAQARRLINSCSGAFRNLVTAALLTGARPPHELAGMRVRDFHPDLGTLSVRDGKTGPREVVLTQEAVAWFAGIAAGRAPDALLLPKDDGTAWKKNNHLRSMREAVAKAKLPKDCSIYALRHTHASQALLNGLNLKLLAENMGTSVLMIEKHYGRFLAASRRRLVEESGFKLGIEPGKVVALG